jgi:flagellar hook-length control protein FliK
MEAGSTETAGSSSASTGQGIPYSTNAWLMSNGSQGANDKVADPSVSSKDGKLGDANSQNAAGSLQNGLPIVLPSIGAALLAQQNALKGKDSAASPDSLNGHSLKTVSISNKIQLITPAQTDTSPQSLISYARGMGLNDSQMHQLFGAEAAKQAAAGAASSQPASTESLISTGTTLPSTTADTTSTSGLDANAQALGTLSTGNTPSDAAASVLSQVSNLQIQINQAPGAIGIQSQATAATLAELNTKVAVSTSAGAINGASGSASASPVSTLEALSVMEASLRPEDVEALQAHFANTTRSTNALGGSGNEGASGSITLDMHTALNSLNPEALGSNLGGSSENSNSGTNSGSSSNPDGAQGNNNVPADMAGAYEKLSNKFAAEISNRLQQQFAQGQWKMKFALRPSSLGIVDIQLEMKDGKLAANFQSNNPLTQNLIHTNSHQLRNALQGSGIDQSSVQVGSGQTSGQGSGSSSGQNSGVPYSYQSNPSSSVAKVTEETPIADDTTQTALSSSNSQLDILA